MNMITKTVRKHKILDRLKTVRVLLKGLAMPAVNIPVLLLYIVHALQRQNNRISNQ